MVRIFTSAQPHLLQLLCSRLLLLGFASRTVQAAGLRSKTAQEGSDPSAFLLSFGIFLHVYPWHVIFTSVFQFSNTNSFVPLLVNSMFTEAKVKRKFGSILLFFYVFIILDHAAMWFRTSSSSHLATHTSTTWRIPVTSLSKPVMGQFKWTSTLSGGR